MKQDVDAPERPAELDDALRGWIVQQVQAGVAPGEVVAPLVARGWSEQGAIDTVEAVVRDYLADHAQANALPPSVRVPAPVESNGSSIIDVDGRPVRVHMHLRHPQVVVFGNVLDDAECDALIALARTRVRRCEVVDADTGADVVHEARTSEGLAFSRGQTALCERIERRIAALLQWPYDHGEGLQILRYGPGAQYRPHHDYFDPERPGNAHILKRGGQRVASLVMYLNTPTRGGATSFPEAGLEVAAVKGHAVFFSYDRPHPMTRTLHAGEPVHEGEKWIATKWLREGVHH
ncbi:2OG-Fe(II) oxygenase [Coralloluteibacterium stylophorae]|uniref:2OG-Fe(II) oxygenase n=1 Tax=Coralloluteibacterium stylophorae TaxID=1776034 RepID=A0A8J7VW99_9GAMM|nr:2OG-Fe(II) oxygenase [Coralloluteibacterium stylophorae]MBS7458932.1 2OG-Fe(II) oxygenase [Coralloluteibacterium stylophorae]